jgi:hemolysin D
MKKLSDSVRLQALSDFAKRYAAIFKHVWAERHKLDSPIRRGHEAEFLPAALELQETPVSPAPRVVMWLLIAFVAIAVLWSIFGKIEVVATAQGKIIPSGGSKVIQPLEAATVKVIHVRDGQQVKAGDVLIELDATTTDADTKRIGNDYLTTHLQAERSKALLASIDSHIPPTIQKLSDVTEDRLHHEQVILDGQYSEFMAKLVSIEANVARREAELRSTQEVVRKLEQTVPIARQRAQDYKSLVEKNFVSNHGYLEKEQVRIEQEADLATQRSRIKELVAALNEGRSQRVALIAEARRTTLDTLNEAEQKTTGNSQELIKAKTRGSLMRLASPVDGTVQQLAIHTVGGVVTPAQALMVVVPQDNTLEVEAFLENKDIGFVNAGQEAAVKVETFPFTKYGTIESKVIHVSHDAIQDEKRGLIYSTRVRLAKATMQVEDKLINLTPGMAVTVEVKTASRRVIEYFLSPLMQYKDESLRER